MSRGFRSAGVVEALCLQSVGAMALGLAAMVAGPAGAADLPSRAAAPAPAWLQVCNVNGVAGFMMPGSDTCLRVGGYATGVLSAGTLSKQYGLAFTGAAGSSPVTSAELTPVRQRDAIGFATRGQVDFEAISQTAYGPLRGYIEFLANSGGGFESPGQGAILNLGYVQFAGLTAGKIGSYFAYLAGGPSWYDFYSPDRYNGNQPNLLAYTATFNGGSATLSLEDPTGAQTNGPVNGGFANALYGTRYPDIVLATRVEGDWGSAQISGVAHNTQALGVSGDSLDLWGGAVLLGATYNLSSLAIGDKISAQVVYSHGALGYSGLTNTAWSPFDQGVNLNGNGTIFPLTDALNFDTGKWSIPNAWSAAGFFEHHFSSQFSVSPQVAFGEIDYSRSPVMISDRATSVMFGGTSHYIPVPHLDFQLGVMYQWTHEATPADYFTGGEPFHANASGLAANLQIVRDF